MTAPQTTPEASPLLAASFSSGAERSQIFEQLQQLAPSGALTSIAAFASSTLSAGVHNLSAVYDGSGAFAPSSASPTENVIGISSTTTTLSGSPNPSYLGKPVTFLLTVTSTLPGASFTHGRAYGRWHHCAWHPDSCPRRQQHKPSQFFGK